MHISIYPSPEDYLKWKPTGVMCPFSVVSLVIKPLNDELNPICHLLALLGAHHILHVGRIRVKYNHPF
jgi:hypothetical protein